jgi:hypothetical protein
MHVGDENSPAKTVTLSLQILTRATAIDFTDIDPTKVQTPSYSGNSSGGTLNVTDGTHSANIASSDVSGVR